jgi:hypothetical protein
LPRNVLHSRIKEGIARHEEASYHATMTRFPKNLSSSNFRARDVSGTGKRRRVAGIGFEKSARGSGRKEEEEEGGGEGGRRGQRDERKGTAFGRPQHR